jgi:glycosyltransferase involved in cell wall biosynthesis
MIEAFERLGYTVDEVVGDTKKRKQRIQDVCQSDREYQFCYSEPTTWPLNPLIDYKFYWYLLRNDIPTSIFYRDIYWQFPELFNHTGLEYLQSQIRFRIDLAVISRIADQIYVPSSSFGEELDIGPSTKSLPPGGIDKTARTDSKTSLQRLIYVGGLSKRYGPELLSKGCELAAAEQNIKLDLVCRKPEYESLPDDVRQRFESEWVTVHHISGDELDDLYQHVDAGVIPILPTQYNNMAIPVKLFEYLSYGLPIITTEITEVASFVRSTDCGLVCDANYNDISDTIITLSENTKLYSEKKENSVQTLKQNRWIDRAEQVASDLNPDMDS